MPQDLCPRPSALRWRPLRQISHAAGPWPPLRPWLTDAGSLTARLMAQSAGRFQVRVLRQLHAIPALHERHALGERAPRMALIREVILEGNGQDWVFARSVLPLSSLTGRLRHLRKQDARPLGAFLFTQPRLCRSDMRVARLRPAQG